MLLHKFLLNTTDFIQNPSPNCCKHIPIAMCRLLITNLTCGHQIRGPLLQCQTASSAVPRGPPHDDGRLVLCSRSEPPLNVHHNTCCEDCFSTIFRHFLGGVCQPCRGVLILRLSSELLNMLDRGSSTEGDASENQNGESQEHLPGSQNGTAAEDALN